MAEKKPNIILIMCDQMRHDCAGFAGHPAARTPALDRMAAEGVRFENAYCASPVCSPARASWITGLYPHAHMQLRNYSSVLRGCYGSMLGPETVTLGDALHGAGYRCGIVGPWHLGDDHQSQHGFDAMWKTYRYQGRPDTDAYINYLREHGLAETFALDGRPELKWKCLAEGKTGADVTALPTEHQRTTWAVDCSVEFVTNQPSPFFLFLSIKDPHPPLLPPRELLGMFPVEKMPVYPSWDEPAEAKPSLPSGLRWRSARRVGYEGVQKMVAHYLALIAHIDNQLARLLAALEQMGIAENTLVAFISDHGEMLGEHGWFGKCMMYEGSVRVPMLLRWPGHLARGAVLSEPVAGVDLMPTLLDLANVPLPAPVHGRSIAEEVRAGREPAPADVFAEIASFEGIHNRQAPLEELAATVLVRSDGWKYIRHRGGTDELYDLQNDPDEMDDLATDPGQAERVGQLRRRIAGLLREQGAGPYAWCLE